MLKKLKINNFKIHRSIDINLGCLNVLTGKNSSGKSSVIQAILLMRQTHLKGELSEGLMLNGELCNIGLVDDAICQSADEDIVGITLTNEEDVCEWCFKKTDNSSSKDFIPVSKAPSCDLYKKWSLFTNKFQYVGASRWEPKESYPLDTNAVEIKNQISLERGMCELVVHYLYYFGKEKKYQINPMFMYEGSRSQDLLDQVSAWEGAISSGVNVIPQIVGKAFVLKYSYNRSSDFVASKEYSATNVGYGLSYALPIIVALLTADKDSLIIIENPETHLHPGGQAKLAELIALVAQSGTQIIIETHSDHIINGILVATKQYEEIGRGIDKNNVDMYFFRKDEETQESAYEQINIVGDGKIDIQPDGFFNQAEKDMSYLLGF